MVPRDRAAQLNPTVRKVAAGAAETTPVAVVTNLARTLRLLKDAGCWVIGADAQASQDADAVDLKGPVVLVMGAEGAVNILYRRELADAVRELEKGWKAPKAPKYHHLRRAYALADLYERSGELPKARVLMGWVAAHDPEFADAAERAASIN